MKQPQYVSIPDSSLLVGVPTHIVSYTANNGQKGEVHLQAGFVYTSKEEDEDEVNYNQVDLFDNPIESTIKDAHYIICAILGIDINSHIYEDCDCHCRNFSYLDQYQITDIRTVFTYQSEADGSSA